MTKMTKMTKAAVKELIGITPRTVYYSLWNDGTKEGRRTACELLNVVECESREDARGNAQYLLQDGTEVVRNHNSLYEDSKIMYFQREGVFVPTVFTCLSDTFKDSMFGYFVSRWSLNPKGHMITDIRGKLNCNFYSIFELDSEEPLDYTHLCSDVERIYSKYAPA